MVIYVISNPADNQFCFHYLRMSPERSPCETRITVPGVESICWMRGNRATLWSFLLKRMFHNTDLTEATRKSLNCAQGISHTLPGGCQPRGQQCLDGWNHPDKPRNSQNDLRPRRKKRETTVTGRRPEGDQPKAQGEEQGQGDAQHCWNSLLMPSIAASLEAIQQARKGKAWTWKNVSDHMKKQFKQLSTPKQLWGFCIIPPVEDGHVLLSWSSFFYICIYFIEMAHGIWAITKRSIQ